MLKLPKLTDQQFAVLMIILVLTVILLQAIVLVVVTAPGIEKIEVEILREPFHQTSSLLVEQPDAKGTD